MYLAFAFFKSSSETNSVLILFNSLKTSTTALSVTAFLTDEPDRNLLMYFPEPIEEYAPYVQPCFSRKFKNNLPSPPPPKIWFANKAAKYSLSVIFKFDKFTKAISDCTAFGISIKLIWLY